ncbi:MAG: peptidase fungalysin [Aeromicrobium sp.]|nr:peptidase fungalysin [Aeromicrobium sp.]
MIVSPAVASNAPHGDAPASAVRSTKADESKGFLDTRQGSRAQQVVSAQKALKKGAEADVKSLRTSVGTDAQISFDPATGTPRNVSSADGYLTGKSTSSASDIVLGYVRSHAADLGLSSADLSTFKLRTSYTDPIGIRHLSYEQVSRGIPVFGNGLRAHVDKNGRLIAIQGSPIAGLGSKVGAAPDAPALSATSARSTAGKDVGGETPSASTAGGKTVTKSTTWSNGDKASLVWFVSGSGVKLGWNTYTTSSTKSGAPRTYTHVVDSASGKVLYRNNLVDNDKGDAYVYDNYPGASKGGKAKKVNFISKKWLSSSATWLQGKYAYVSSDLNDDNIVQTSERGKLPAGAKLKAFGKTVDPFCKSFVCTWDPNTPSSWAKNMTADSANAFYLASSFHDYLAAKPFGFTGSAGNFEQSDGDPVLLQTLDGADTDSGLPDGNHIDNANMATPPDGTPPTMQMYLWHFPGTTDDEDPYVPTSGAFDASILLHEYTHGLSGRLVVDPTGNSTLNSIQAGAMGEAWSDYYAEDYLVSKGFVSDSSKDGDILEGKYVTAGAGIRTEAQDCTVGKVSTRCPAGGYTYGDFPTIGGSPEVHASGEVWAQTLWDIRKKFGHTKADTLITQAMQLSPADPTMLDMRNAILQADKVAYQADDKSSLWTIFAARGMGYFAGAIDGGDTQPAEDFHVPPSAELPLGSLSGTVTDANTLQPLVGAIVRITGHDSGFIGSFTAVTDGAGHYSIGNVPAGTYKKVVASADGYEIASAPVTVAAGGSTKNFVIRKDYAAASGGASITHFNGPDYTEFGCGPGGAIDLSQGTGWGSTTGNDDGDPASTIVPKAIIIKLPHKINITTSATNTAFAVDPTATCGDPGSSSTGTYKIDVSQNGILWTTAVNGTGAKAFTAANQYKYTNVASAVNANGVQYVRFTMLSPQVPDFSTNCPDGPFGGCQFMDMTEFEVFGSPTP